MNKTVMKAAAGALLAYFLFVLLACILLPLSPKRAGGQEESPGAGFQTLAAGESAGDERVLCIDDNSEALLWRLLAIEAAQEEIILSTFNFKADNSGQDILSALLSAANRGVQVKVLIDGLSGLLDVQGRAEFQALAASPQAEIRIYNPIRFLKLWEANYRLHDKYLIVDEQLYLLGGRNIGDLFLGDYQAKQNTDRDILVYSGQADGSLGQLRDYFQQVWELPDCRPLQARADSPKVQQSAQALQEHYEQLPLRLPQAFQPVDWEAETLPARHISLLSNPVEASNKAPTLWTEACRIMDGGRDILIQTPYVICGRAMYADLTALSSDPQRQLRILTNAVENGANPWGCSDYLNQKTNILATGADIYEYVGAHSLHTKTILVDDDLSLVGSYNLDMRSTYLDTELMLLIDCPALNRQLRETAAQAMSQCKLALSDGGELEGPSYEPASLSPLKGMVYALLRVLTVPIRHLL